MNLGKNKLNNSFLSFFITVRGLLLSFFIFFEILILINSGFSYEYNSSYTDLYLDSNGWCSGLEVDFTVYNITEWENKNNIEDDLCKPGCSDIDCDSDDASCFECDNDCTNFQSFEDATINIYNGPLDSMSFLLEEGKVDANNKFVQLFSSPNQYLIEIFQGGNFNDYHDVLYIDECAHADPIVIQSNEESFTNQSFSYLDSKLLLEVFDTSIITSNDILVIDASLDDILNNTIEVFQISFPSGSDFSSINIKIKIDVLDDSILKAYSYDVASQKWDSVSFVVEENFVIIDSVVDGIFSITNEKVVDEKVTVLTQEPVQDLNDNLEGVDSDLIGDINNEANEIENDVSMSANSDELNLDDENNIIMYVIGFVVVVVVGLVIMIKSGSSTPSDLPEVVTSYEEVYNRSKAYVRKYRDNYLKDQVYRALKDAKVPKDIIDKIFNEEY